MKLKKLVAFLLAAVMVLSLVACGGNNSNGNDEAGYSYIIASKTVDLRAKSKEINSSLNGRGGGQPTMIQGSFKAKKEEIIEYIKSEAAEFDDEFLDSIWNRGAM